MFRKLLIAATIAAGSFAGTAAFADPPALQGRHDGRDRDSGRHDRADYRVSIRHFGHWHTYRTYDDRDDAERVARQLERRGYDAKIERVRPR